MRRLKKWGLIALLILLGLEILTIAPKKIGTFQEAEKTPEPKDPNAEKSQVATMSQAMRGVHLIETGSGRKEWELDAADAQTFKDKATWQLSGVKVHFFGSGHNTYTVTGQTGSIQTETKDMTIAGNVVGTTSEGYTFKTKSLRYAAQKKSLSTEDDVEMLGPKERGVFSLSGKGFDANLGSTAMHINKDVRAVKAVGADKTMTIKSSWALINGKTNEAHFEELVQVDIDAIRMTGNKADFIYDKKTNALDSLLMQGNVKVTDQKHWASSQYAKVLFKDNEFVLYGNPRVIQDDNELHGEEIRFLKGGEEVQVVKAKARVEDRADMTGMNKTKAGGSH